MTIHPDPSEGLTLPAAWRLTDLSSDRNKTIPQTLGPYRLEWELGRGGMGVVYVGLDTRLQRRVAIKFLPVPVADEALELFKKEARLLASLNHPNIATIHSLENIDDRHFLTLELIDGRTLRELISGPPQSLVRLLEIGRDVARALQAAHAHGVIHCDLKPANVLITPDGTVKLLDFGIARAMGERSDLADGGTVGTPGYMSPEQINGESVDRRTDVWALGVILFELLARRSPFNASTAEGMIVATLREEPHWEHIPASTPIPVRDVMRRCLSQDRSDRPASVDEVIEVLSPFLEGPTPSQEMEEALTAQARDAIAVGKPAPDFTLDNIHGEPISLARLRKEGPVVIHFYRGKW